MVTFRFYEKTTQVVFFDLEFFVPKPDRPPEDASSLVANPWDPGHMLLGGCFLKDFPLQKKEPELSHLWIWQHDHSESALLRQIYDYFRKCWETVEKKPGQADPIISGVGVGRIDMPYLYTRCLSMDVAPARDLFRTFFLTRPVDLETVSIPYFKNNTTVLYPKTTSQLIQLFRIDRVRHSGTSVWDMYDRGDYRDIQDRTEAEVRDSIEVFKIIVNRTRANALPPRISMDSYNDLLGGCSSADDKDLVSRAFEVISEGPATLRMLTWPERLRLRQLLDATRRKQPGKSRQTQSDGQTE